MKIHEIFEELKKACSSAKEKYGMESVLPDEDLCQTPKNIQCIIVGDNPGKEEVKEGKYFWGPQTHYMRDFLEKVYGEDYEKKVLLLNKTPLSTPNTIDLKKIKGEDPLKETQLKMADLIQEITKMNRVPVWIMGTSQLKGLFENFYESVKEMPNVVVFNHPSRSWFLRTDLKEAMAKEKLTKKDFKEIKLSTHESERLLKELQRIGTERKKVL